MPEHSVAVTAANVSERDVVPQPVREDDEVVYGGAGYTGMSKPPEIASDPHRSAIDYPYQHQEQVSCESKGPGIDWDARIEARKSRGRSQVENVFLIIKQSFGCEKVRYRGLKKNASKNGM